MMGARKPTRRTRRSHQRAVLRERYLDVLVGDWRAVALLLLQAPLIAALVVGVWSNVKSDTRSLYFVLCLSAFFLGAVNSAREIVKEREIFLRERLLDLSCVAYLDSKVSVLVLVGAIQCLSLTAIVAASLPLKVSVFLLFTVLLAMSMAGVLVGLFISAWSRRDDRAVMMVPLVVIPQILFSDFVLSGPKLRNWAGVVQRGMPVHWGYTVLDKAMSGSPDASTVVSALLVSVALCVVLYLLTIARLTRTSYGS